MWRGRARAWPPTLGGDLRTDLRASVCRLCAEGVTKDARAPRRRRGGGYPCARDALDRLRLRAPSSQVPSPTTGSPALSRERDLAEGPPRRRRRDDRVGRPHDQRVARLAEPGRDRDLDPAVGLAAVERRAGARRSSRPRERAPRQAASMTPPRPPETSTAPAAASAAPTSSATRELLGGVARPAPTTAIHGAWAASASYRTTKLTSLPGTTTTLTISLPSTCACSRGVRAQRLELVARRCRRRLDAVAQLAVDLHDQLQRVALEHRRVGVRPRLLPHALARSAARRPPRRSAGRTGRSARRRSPSRSAASPAARRRGGGSTR